MDRYTGTRTALNRLEHEHMVTIARLHIISISGFNTGTRFTHVQLQEPGEGAM